MSQFRKLLHGLLIWLIIVIVIAYALVGLLVWRLFGSERVLMGVDHLVAWCDERLGIKESEWN